MAQLTCKRTAGDSWRGREPPQGGAQAPWSSSTWVGCARPSLSPREPSTRVCRCVGCLGTPGRARRGQRLGKRGAGGAPGRPEACACRAPAALVGEACPAPGTPCTSWPAAPSRLPALTRRSWRVTVCPATAVRGRDASSLAGPPFQLLESFSRASCPDASDMHGPLGALLFLTPNWNSGQAVSLESGRLGSRRSTWAGTWATSFPGQMLPLHEKHQLYHLT